MIQRFISCVLLSVAMMGLSKVYAQSAACETVAECAQLAVEAAQDVRDTLDAIIPPGAVMAFNLSECPAGWAAFNEAKGRVIVGVGEGNRDALDRRLTPRALKQTGGVEVHTLAVGEMPSHNHAFSGTPVTRGGNNGTGRVLSVGNAFSFDTYTPAGSISNSGGNAPHQNMPPFISLLMCQRV